jgi:hypothetical protein
MTLSEMEVIYNLVFIGVLIVVCALYSVVHILIRDKTIKIKSWIFNSLSFFVIVMVTIYIWRVAIPYITKVPL